ncbi:hypothetical protein ACA910_001082 [Epithemia clementina (nom. ined.)]
MTSTAEKRPLREDEEVTNREPSNGAAVEGSTTDVDFSTSSTTDPSPHNNGGNLPDGSVISAITDHASIGGAMNPPSSNSGVVSSVPDAAVPAQVILDSESTVVQNHPGIVATAVSPPPPPIYDRQIPIEPSEEPMESKPYIADSQSIYSTSAIPDPPPALEGETVPTQPHSVCGDPVITTPPTQQKQQAVFMNQESGDTLDDYIRSPEVQNAIVERSPGGRYVRFMEKLGSGASKDVYRAYDTQEGIEVAWNVVTLSGVPKTERNRIVNEVRLLERLHHANIISFHGSWVNRERQEVNFVTEILSSGTLKSFINKVQVIRWKIAKRWAVQILKGLEYLHSQEPPVIHRDLKCENIFINGTSGDLRIGDLGLSTVHRNGRKLSVLGTPEFMAPDLYDDRPYDEKVDIYAFGMCMLEIFTKEIPYSECNNPAQIYKKVSSGEPPEILSRLQSRHAREFVEYCMGFKDENGIYVRPSAAELLKHPFLMKRPNDDDEVVVERPLRERTISETTESTNTNGSSLHRRRQESSTGVSASSYKFQQYPHHASQGNHNYPEAPVSMQPARQEQEPYSYNEADGNDHFDEMPESETNMKKVKVLMGRDQVLNEDEDVIQAPTVPVASTDHSATTPPVYNIQEAPHTQPVYNIQEAPPTQPVYNIQEAPPTQPVYNIQEAPQAPPTQPVYNIQEAPPTQPVYNIQEAPPTQPMYNIQEAPPTQPMYNIQEAPPTQPMYNIQEAPPTQSQPLESTSNQIDDSNVSKAAKGGGQYNQEVVSPSLGTDGGQVQTEDSKQKHYLVAAAVIEHEGPDIRPYADDILKLVVTLPVEGQTQNVQFEFHLVEDDAVQVAKEMVQELDIPQDAVLEISETISGLACAARMKQDKYTARMKNQSLEQVGHAATVSGAPASEPMSGTTSIGSATTVPPEAMVLQNRQISGLSVSDPYTSIESAPQEHRSSLLPSRNSGPIVHTPAQPLHHAQAQSTGDLPAIPQSQLIHSQQQIPTNGQGVAQAAQPTIHAHDAGNEITPQPQVFSQGSSITYQGAADARIPHVLPQSHNTQLHVAPDTTGQPQTIPQKQENTTDQRTTAAHVEGPANLGAPLQPSHLQANSSTEKIEVQSYATPAIAADVASNALGAQGQFSQVPGQAPPPSFNTMPVATAVAAVEAPSTPLPCLPPRPPAAAYLGDSAPSGHGDLASLRTVINGMSPASRKEELYHLADEMNDEVREKLRKLEEDYQKNLKIAKKVFDSRMENLERSQTEKEAQHQKFLEKHEKERAAFEKRRALEEEQQLRRIEQLQKEWDKKREMLAQQMSALSAAETEAEGQAILDSAVGALTGATAAVSDQQEILPAFPQLAVAPVQQRPSTTSAASNPDPPQQPP